MPRALRERPADDWRSIRSDLDQLRAASHGGRMLLGIAGAPGSGKTTLAARLGEDLGPELSVVVPMDGFHLAQNVIAGTPLEHRRGAIDTFDGWGFAALLRRIVTQTDHTIYAPTFRRGLEDPIAGSIPIAPQVPIVIVEGNYLLAEASPWNEIRSMLDAAWYVESDEQQRVERLIQRHIEHGMDEHAAGVWAHTVDAANADYVASTRGNADRVIRW